MPSQNLDQIAWDYLTGTPRDQATMSNILVNTGAVAIFPLLRAGVRLAWEFNPLRTKGVKPLDNSAAESTWIYQIAEPMLENIGIVAYTIGQPAYDALCRALWDPDVQLKVFAAVVLLQEPHHSPRTIKQLEDAFYQITSNDRDKKYFMQSGIFIALSNILARAGDMRHQKLMQDMAAEQNYAIEHVIETTRNTLLLYLIR